MKKGERNPWYVYAVLCIFIFFLLIGYLFVLVFFLIPREIYEYFSKKEKTT